MKIDVKLFPLDVTSTSGTHVPKEIFEEYLNSDRCKDALERRIATGGLTHITRSMPDYATGKVGLDDIQLLDGNSTHYIEKYWIGSDNYVYCTAVTFDPELFDYESAKFIKRLEGYLKSKVHLGTSVVVDSINNKMTGKSMNLLSIIGFDFTYNPAFTDTKIVKIYE